MTNKSTWLDDHFQQLTRDWNPDAEAHKLQQRDEPDAMRTQVQADKT